MKWLPDDIDLTDYMQSQEMRQKVRPASDFRADVLQRLKSDPSLTGERLPWKKTEKLIRFRAGELTLWTGINGHGKSKLLGQVATGLMYQGAAVCIASLEMHPAETVKRMVEQAEGNGDAQSATAISTWTGLTIGCGYTTTWASANQIGCWHWFATAPQNCRSNTFLSTR